MKPTTKVLRTTRGGKEHVADYETYTHKECSRCHEIKPIEEFGKTTAKTKIGWAWRSQCRECGRASCRKYGAENKPRRNERLRDWRKQNPHAATANDKRKRLRYKYGLTPEALDDLYARASGQCEVCGSATARLCVDHCHATGRVRGILCPSCNTFLGRVENNGIILQKLTEYLAERCRR